MKKRIFTVALAATFLFAGAMLFQVENAEAQDATPADATPVDAFPKLGKWIPIYAGGVNPIREECFAHSADECSVGDKRRVPAVVAGPAVPVNN